jgi:hypothetical protein
MKAKLTADELIDREARRLAKEALEKELAIRDLPLPKDSVVEAHITQMLARDPSFKDEATKLVEARTDAYTEGLKAIGIGSNTSRPIPTLDIQLKI